MRLGIIRYGCVATRTLRKVHHFSILRTEHFIRVRGGLSLLRPSSYRKGAAGTDYSNPNSVNPVPVELTWPPHVNDADGAIASGR